MSEEEKNVENLSPGASSGASSKVSLIILLVCVISSAIGLAMFLNKDEVNSSPPPKNGIEGQGNLVDGKEYMIYIHKIEVAPNKSNGDPWDGDDSAPDVYYQLVWKNNQIYKSDTKKDSLIANWIPIGLDLKDTLLKGSVAVDQAVNVPTIKRESKDESSDELLFKIMDDDLVGDDEVEVMKVYISKLNLGNNVFDYTDKEGHGIIKALIRVIDNSLSTNEKIELLMRGE